MQTAEHVDTASPFMVFEVHPELLESGKKATALAASDILSGSVLATRSGLPRPEPVPDRPPAVAVAEARPQPDPGS